MFQQKLKFINQKLDSEIEPFKPVSKDHLRVNRVGVNLEQLDAAKRGFRNERKSLDMSTIKKKKFNQNNMHQRKQSYAPDNKSKFDTQNAQSHLANTLTLTGGLNVTSRNNFTKIHVSQREQHQNLNNKDLNLDVSVNTQPTVLKAQRKEMYASS